MEIVKEHKYVGDVGSEQIEMGICNQDVPFIMMILRNQTYSNPVQSFVREVISNATDAHTRANKETIPIKVEILSDPLRFVVTDYGDSMTKEKVSDVYANLGSSDRRGNNEAIGGFGIGSASPLAYTTKFFIETKTKENNTYIYRHYAQYIDKSEKGKLGLLQEEKVLNEETGTIITIPIKADDIKSIRNYAFHYFRYMAVTPEHNLGEDKTEESYHKSYQGSNWSFYEVCKHKAPKGIVAVHGGIPYDISIGTLEEMSTTPEENQILYWMQLIRENALLDITFPIGSLQLSLSREELQYTQKTFTSVVNEFKNFVEEMRIILWRSLNQTKKLYSNIQAYRKLKECLQPIAKEIEIFNERLFTPKHLLNELNIKAEPVDDYLTYEGREYSVKYHHINVTYKSSRLQEQNHHSIYWDKPFCFLICDENLSSYNRYTRPLLDSYEGYSRVYLVDEDFLKGHPVLEQIDTYRVSELKAKKRKQRESKPKTKKENFTVYELAYRNQRERCKGITKHCREITLPKETEETLYYILLDDWFQFRVHNCMPCLTEDNYEDISEFINIHNLPSNSVFFVKPKDKNKIGKNWVNLLDVYWEKVKQLGYSKKENEAFMKEYNLFITHKSMKHLFNKLRIIKIYETLEYKNTSFYKLLELSDSLEVNFELQQDRLNILSFSNLRLDDDGYYSRSKDRWRDTNEEYYKGHQLTTLVTQVCERYPLLNIYIENQSVVEHHSDFTETWLTQYVDSIEALMERQYQMHPS